MLSKGADAFDYDPHSGESTLTDAIDSGLEDVASRLINMGVNINGHFNSTFGPMDTPLLFALRKGRIRTALVLIEKGAKIDARDMNSNKLLALALENDRRDVAQLLITKGADVNTTDLAGNSPLILAVKSGFDDIVTSLISRGANLAYKDTDGKTALIWAEKNRQANIASRLRAAGAKE